MARAEQLPPHNIEAEESLLGAMLLSRPAVAVAMDSVTAADFYVPRNGEMFKALAYLYHAGKPIDPVTVVAAYRQAINAKGSAPFDRSTLAALQANTPASANATEYARIVSDHASLRRFIAAADALRALGYGADLDGCDQLVANLPNLLQRTAVPVDVGVDVLDLIEREYPMQWLVTDLLERGDRVMLSGPEGWGKTTLCRQLGLMLACGIHPFKRHRITPCRILMLDCENSDSQNTQAFRWLHRKCNNQLAHGMMTVVNRRQGLNLRSRGDLAWVDGLLTHYRPDVLVCGPLYKMFEGSPGIRKDSEEAADEVARAFDQLRVKHDVALLIEAHAPHGESGDRAGYRPYGASLWMRWPEFGLGMKPEPGGVGVTPSIRLVHWRGARDRNRDWPERLYEGHYWPWESAEAWEPPQADPNLGI